MYNTGVKNRSYLTTLILGDVITVAVLTVIGFATHNEVGSGLYMLTTFLPLAAAWALAAPPMGLYDPRITSDPRQLWRVAAAGLLAGPFAAWLRSYMLGNRPIIPVFALVLAITAVVGMLVWRGLMVLWAARRKPTRQGWDG